MAGHSKWANIKHKKGKADAQRGKLFTKLSRYITVAAKEGGADLEYNTALKSAVEKAKAENMPNDNIEKAINKGTGNLDGVNYEEIRYEGYGPSGIAVLVECLSDNRNRSASDVRHAFDKYGGNLGSSGCVSWMFDRKGIIIIDKSENNDVDEEELMLEAIDLGAEDFNGEEDFYEIITSVENLNHIKDELSKNYSISSFDLEYLPQNTSKLEDEQDIKNMMKLIDVLEDNDDVQKVYHNWEIPDNLEF